MNLLKLADLRIAVAVVAALALATACGSSAGERDKSDLVKPNIPSVARDQRVVTSGLAMPRADAGLAAGSEVEPDLEPALPTTFRGLMRSGKKLARSGRAADALRAFESAAANNKRASSPRIEMARLRISQKNYRRARTHAEVAVRLAPRSSYAWNTLGRVELGEGNREAAITSFERSTEENADNSYAWNNLGYTLMLESRWDEAITALEQATSGNRPTKYMWNNLGMAYEHEDRLGEARAAYRQAATAGSRRAQQSLGRLRGVKTIKIEKTNPDASDPVESASTTDTSSGKNATLSEDEAEQTDAEDVLGC